MYFHMAHRSCLECPQKLQYIMGEPHLQNCPNTVFRERILLPNHFIIPFNTVVVGTGIP